ncbi:MAG: hypothetical protein PHQ78_06840 [Candidatus Cloacimonetes bacterium]|jgi:hypothetical protein|nr:hypothetical protein [Candidatus Cloacimonadota bacterium]MDD2507015.1 hypothetical protein [Candidatus Cloacimonadota bacterium]MDD4560515.1 hypothetical protein [Candidatus Cloacimonadota bacterium]
MSYVLKIVDMQSGEARQIAGGYSYWHNPRFMEAIARLHNVTALQLQVFKGEQLFAILPLYERRKMGMKALVTPIGAYYQGISFAHESSAGKARVLLDSSTVCFDIARFLAERYKRINFKLSPENDDVRGFTWNGFKATPLYTFRCQKGEILNALPDERRNFRIAKNLGMELVEAFDPDVFLALHKKLEIKKNHSFGLSYKAMRVFLIQLYDAGLLKQFNVLWEKKPVSANILLYDGADVVYTLFKATSEEALRKGTAAFDSLSIIQNLPEGSRFFDYCGANLHDVARFKAALGLHLCVFYQIKM